MNDAPRNDPWPSSPPPPGYGQPPFGPTPVYGSSGGYGGPPARPASNGIGVAAMAVGIVSLLFTFLFFPLGFLLAITAIILGIVGMKKASKGEATNKGMAIAGVVTGGIASVIALLTIFIAGLFSDSVQDLGECIEQALTVEKEQDCQTQF